MARKTLLTESEIRRFMKLASMPAIGSDRMGTLSEQPVMDDEAVEAEEEFDMGGDEEVDIEDEMEMDVEPDADLEMSDEEVEELSPEAVSVVEDAQEKMLERNGLRAHVFGGFF